MNLVILIGNLVTKPEVTKLKDKYVVTLRLATSEGNLPTEYHTVKQFTQYVTKFEDYEVGDSVLVDGSVQYRSYEIEGQKKWVTEIIAKKIQRMTQRPQKEDW